MYKMDEETKKSILAREPFEFSEEEETYRRGYSQGFAASRQSPEVTVKEVYRWRHSEEKKAPPGSGMAGVEMSCENAYERRSKQREECYESMSGLEYQEMVQEMERAQRNEQ